MIYPETGDHKEDALQDEGGEGCGLRVREIRSVPAGERVGIFEVGSVLQTPDGPYQVIIACSEKGPILVLDSQSPHKADRPE